MDNFTTMGDVVTVPAGSGYLGTQPIVLVSDVIPSGVQAMIDAITCRALDVDVTQIRFAFRRNGASPSLFLSAIPASMFVSTANLKLNELCYPGTLSIVAYNLSGTGLPNAGPAVSPLCQAGWYGDLLTPPVKESIKIWFPTLRRSPWKVRLALTLLLLCPSLGQAQSLVVPGSTAARSALPIACVNQTTFALESCGGGGGLTDAQLRATPVPISGTVTTTPPANASPASLKRP